MPNLRLVLAVTLLCAGACEAQVVPNAELERLYKDDQADRRTKPIDWTVVTPRDTARRSMVTRMLKAGKLRLAADYRAAAMIFQHGTSDQDIQLALALATIGTALDPEDAILKFLTAAAWDRRLTRHDRPQWYGTQYKSNEVTKQLELLPVDEGAVSDDERANLGVPSLSEARAGLNR